MKRSVVADDRRLTNLQMEVTRAPLDGGPEQGVQIHVGHIGRLTAAV
jgi:hypothetical protein